MYISIDIETTGLDPKTDQILQIAAVAWTNDDVNKCEAFDMFVDPSKGTQIGNYGENIRGGVYALNMNGWILQELANGKGESISDVSDEFSGWLNHLPGSSQLKTRHTSMGMNFGSFDLQFLKAAKVFPVHSFRHRCLEVGSLYATKAGIPSSAEIFMSLDAGFYIKGKAHEALFDAKCTLAAAMVKLA